MGITYREARSLWDAHLRGMVCDSIAMVGHQQLFLHPSELAELRAAYRKNGGRAAEPLADYRFGEYIDRFCREYLGAASIEIIDYSAYEGATVVHDMNNPVPDRLHNRFDVVIEAGSLEHIFNFPVSMGNIMKAVKVGGSVFLTTPANNLCGHGFYQFSPELMFRIFAAGNGFDPPSVVFLQADYPSVELTPVRNAFEVSDPASVGGRVGLRSNGPIMMMVHAKKMRHVEPFQTTPQQSDYQEVWKQEASATEPRRRNIGKEFLKRIARGMPLAWMRQFEGYRSNRRYSLSNRSFYRKIE